MLFTLHDDFSDLSVADWQDYSDELHALLDAHRSAHHIFLPSRAVLPRLLSCDFLGRVCLATLSEIRGKYVELEALRAQLPRVAIIYDASAGQLPINNGTEKSIDVPDLLNSRLLSPFKLLVENLKIDGDFWGIVFAVIAHHEFGSWGCPRFEIANGGGGATAQVAQYLAQRQEPFFCIVDSDRRSPYAPAGQTASATRQVLLSEGFILEGDNGLSSQKIQIGCSVLPTREIENLVPLSIIGQLLHEVGSANFRHLSKLLPSQPNLNAADWRILDFYDMKDAQNLPAEASYHCHDEKVFFEVMVARVGDPLPAIRERLIEDFVEYHSGRHSVQRLGVLRRELVQCPHFSELRRLFWGVVSLGCVPPSRWF